MVSLPLQLKLSFILSECRLYRNIVIVATNMQAKVHVPFIYYHATVAMYIIICKYSAPRQESQFFDFEL